MKIPNTGRRRALLLVDIQPQFINERVSYIVENTFSLLRTVPYDFYAYGLISAGKDSLWNKQHGWVSDDLANLTLVPSLKEELIRRNALEIRKNTRSIFKGMPSVIDQLTANKIEEVHLVGVDTYDCITASAHESFDSGFFTYVIEECCQCTSGQDLHDRAVQNLRFVNLTNNSCREAPAFIEVELAR